MAAGPLSQAAGVALSTDLSPSRRGAAVSVSRRGGPGAVRQQLRVRRVQLPGAARRLLLCPPGRLRRRLRRPRGPAPVVEG